MSTVIPCPSCGKDVRHYGTPPACVASIVCVQCLLTERGKADSDTLELPAFLNRRKKKTEEVLTDDLQSTTSQDVARQE